MGINYRMKQWIFLGVIFLMGFLEAKMLEVGTQPIYQTEEYVQYTLANNLDETPDVLESRSWFKDKISFNTFKNLDKAYWVHLKVQNVSHLNQEYYLLSENQFTYYLEFFLVKNGKIIVRQKDGVISKNRDRAFNTNHIIFPVPMAVDESLDIFIKIQNYNKIDLKFSLVNQDYLIDFYQTYTMVEGLFFGGMLIMLLYNLFLYLLLKSRIYLYYVVYLFWLTVYFVGFFGFSQRYFADYLWVFYFSAGLFFIAMTLFIGSILNLKEQLPWVNKILNLFIIYFAVTTLVNIFCLQIEAFFYAQLLFNLFFIMVPIYGFVIIVSTYYLAFYKKDKIAKNYVVLWTLVALFSASITMSYLHLMKVDIPSDYIIQFMMLFEVLCFSFMLAFKMREVEQEKRHQQQLLLQQNKLASMGEMLSTIAHQWRQPLSEINGVVLKLDIDYRKQRLNQHRLEEHLNSIEEVTIYLSKTIHDFINFFDHDKELELFILNEVLHQSSKLVFMSNYQNSVVYKQAYEKIELFGYKHELMQALIIVMKNALDACHKINVSPRLEIELLVTANSVTIAIADNGGGVNPELLEKVFTPYFTTKHESKGTGLGLYIVKMIIEQSMQGSVTLSNGSRGATCSLTIPKKINRLCH